MKKYNLLFIIPFFFLFSFVLVSGEVEEYLFRHTNTTITVAIPGVFYNITFAESNGVSQGINHTHDDTTNDTFTITKDGVYDLHAHLSFQDSAALPVSNIVFRFIKNGVEIPGSLREKDLDKKDWDTLASTTIFAEFNKGDEIKLQFTSDETTVSLESDHTYGVHEDTSVIKIKKIAYSQGTTARYYLYSSLFIGAVVLFLLGYWLKEKGWILSISSAILFIILGLYFVQHGFPNFTNSFIINSTGILLAAIGLGIIAINLFDFEIIRGGK